MVFPETACSLLIREKYGPGATADELPQGSGDGITYHWLSFVHSSIGIGMQVIKYPVQEFE